MKINVVVAAAGSAKRAKTAENKIFVKSAEGKPMLFYSVGIFRTIPDVKKIIIAAKPSEAEKIAGIFNSDEKNAAVFGDAIRPESVKNSPKNLIGGGSIGYQNSNNITQSPNDNGSTHCQNSKNVSRSLNNSCRIVVCGGGKTRSQSIKNALNYLDDDCEIVLIHDAARPYTERAVIERVISDTVKFGSSVPALPVTDTLKYCPRAEQTEMETPRFNTQNKEIHNPAAAAQSLSNGIRKNVSISYGQDKTPNAYTRAAQNETINNPAAAAQSLSNGTRKNVPVTVNREDYFTISTPQGFFAKEIIRAYSMTRYENDGLSDRPDTQKSISAASDSDLFNSQKSMPDASDSEKSISAACNSDPFTDDSSVYEKYIAPVHLTEGQPSNIKITTQQDVETFKTARTINGILRPQPHEIHTENNDINKKAISETHDTHTHDTHTPETQTPDNDINKPTISKMPYPKTPEIHTENDDINKQIADEFFRPRSLYIHLYTDGKAETVPNGIPPDLRIGSGYDIHRLTEGRKLILGGVEIPHRLGLDGHSDADALIHSVIDALLAAVASRDIGFHFPDNDPAYKNVPSLVLLEKTRLLMLQKRASVVNLSSIIAAQSPRLSPYVEPMRLSLAAALKIPVERVSVACKTNERLSEIGKENAIAVNTVCLVKIE
ncbi:MAG: 2-C-methyl-D-erythritol 2,4-cyclodiphosphate synthase [Clostridiales bacterium]|nr:2-C-methyl-D-erythritol 2,4-cyclodiphosphate synthase [Clostridiales bacterium]